MAWEVDAGPAHVGPEGPSLRPQLKVGYQDNHFQAQVGVDDVRDGLSASAAVNLRRIYEAEGTSLQQVLGELHADSEIAVLDDIARAVPSLLAQVMKSMDVEIPPDSRVHARVTAMLGVGVGAGVCLGWADTHGYRMVGVKGAVSAAVTLGADLMAGMHTNNRLFKIIIGVGNVLVEAVYELSETAAKRALAMFGQEEESTAASGRHSLAAPGDSELGTYSLPALMHSCCPGWSRYFF